MNRIEPHSIGALNALPPEEQRRRYGALLPRALLTQFDIHPETYTGPHGQPLLTVHSRPGASSVEMKLLPPQAGADLLFYGHFADTRTGQIIVLLVVINDPAGPRFAVDRMPDGRQTEFGEFLRNVPAEAAALQAGLAPGQVRRGLRLMPQLIESWETFLAGLGQNMYFVEPLYYHNAAIFERYGFAYQQGKRFMESIHYRFSQGDLRQRLDASTPFRQPEFADRIRGRSWAIHDGLMGEPFTGVHMYKHVGQHAGVSTFPNGRW